VGDGAADPAAVAVDHQGRWIVALSGVNEAAIVTAKGLDVNRLDVGRLPAFVLPDPKSDRAVVVNTFSDSVTVLDTEAGRVLAEISLGPQPELGPVERGRRLFHDARLSHDRWMTCHSCHTDGHTTGLLTDTLGDGAYGSPKRTLSLLGTGPSGPWAWNGQMKELHDQVFKSIETTMHADDEITAEQVSDLTAYLMTLPPPPPLMPVESASDEEREQIERGGRVFERQGCNRCHVPSLTYTTEGAFDVGLADEIGTTKFNPPSLRGVGRRGRLFHDGRAATLEEVFDRFGHQLGARLSEQERADLLRFLRSL
ncbi:MAG: cytochrome c peroxidase, partial [Planctomycetaceae bacterium]